MELSRFYFRCTWCERVVSVNCSSEEVNAVIKAPCPLCNEVALRVMGRVEKSNIVRTSVKSACDERCTNAQGPHCSCECSQVNHGTKKLISFDKIVGKLSVVNAEMLNNNEAYLQRIKRMAEAKNKIKVNVIAFLTWKNKKILDWLKQPGNSSWRLAYEEYHAYQVYKKTLERIDKIEDLKSIQKKINSLTGLIKKIGSNLEYLEAIFDKKQEQVKV
jgi:hypothetical protein